MAKQVAGITGRVSGKVASVVGASWKGIPYFRQHVIPTNPNTAAQQAQRALMTSCVALAKNVLASVLQPYWNPFQRGKSGYNRFCQKNLKLMGSETDYASMFLAEGQLEPTSGVGAAEYTTGTGNLSYSWSGTTLGNGDENDKVVAVAYDAAHDIAFVSDAADIRGAESGLFNIGEGRDPDDIHFWLFFYRGTGSDLIVSPSAYHTVVAP